MSQSDSDAMVADAEKYKEEDEKQKQKLEAKNQYENYVYHMKTTIQDEKMKELQAMDGVYTVRGPMCRWELKPEKPTGNDGVPEYHKKIVIA